MSDAEWRAYPYVAAPTVVVLAVGPGLATLAPSLSVDPGPVRWVGLPVVAAGLALVGWAVHAFARAGASPSPVERPAGLVTAGPLAYTRNPIYLGTVLAAGGEAIVLGSVLVGGYAAALWVVYHLLTVYHEEPELRAEFGADYESYCRRVPRWL